MCPLQHVLLRIRDKAIDNPIIPALNTTHNPHACLRVYRPWMKNVLWCGPAPVLSSGGHAASPTRKKRLPRPIMRLLRDLPVEQVNNLDNRGLFGPFPRPLLTIRPVCFYMRKKPTVKTLWCRRSQCCLWSHPGRTWRICG